MCWWWRTTKAKTSPFHRGGRIWWQSLYLEPHHPHPSPGENWVLGATGNTAVKELIHLKRNCNDLMALSNPWFLVHWFPFTLIQGYAWTVPLLYPVYQLASIPPPLTLPWSFFTYVPVPFLPLLSVLISSIPGDWPGHVQTVQAKPLNSLLTGHNGIRQINEAMLL